MHETIAEDGIARMRAIPVLEIADGETIIFERGGKHLMLMQPVGKPGTVTLNFYSDDVLLLSVSTEFTAAME
jgi:copper(I)-binding protein